MLERSKINELYQRDTGLTGLANVVDEHLVAQHLGISPSDVTLVYLRYKPMTNCLAHFRIANHTTTSVYAKTFATRDQAKISHSANKTSNGCLGPVEYHPGCLLYQFPTDAKLGSLTRLAQEPSWLAERFNLAFDPDSSQLLAYKPERRCVIRINNPHSSYVLKLYSNSAFAAAHRAAKTVQTQFSDTPQVLKKSRRHRALLFEFTPGPTMREEIQAGRVAESGAVAGRLLAKFHNLSIAAGESRDPYSADHELLAWLLPEAKPQVLAIVTAARSLIQQATPTRVVLHGDYYDKQIIVADNGSPSLLDLDDLSQGDHRIDLATYIAHLEALKPAEAYQAIESFLNSYKRMNSNSLAALNAFVALATLQLAHHPFRRALPNWDLLTREYISRAQRWLDIGGTIND